MLSTVCDPLWLHHTPVRVVYRYAGGNAATTERAVSTIRRFPIFSAQIAGYVWLLRQIGTDGGRPQKCLNFPMKFRNRAAGHLSEYEGERAAHRVLTRRPPSHNTLPEKPIRP